ncbi:MAG: stage III sporulation protein AE [Christensenellaceae bacterium]|jgi:stage III sporulation protein AE|nr:stage III sporulation protein AE [Christensenellaceae bacterium]
MHGKHANADGDKIDQYESVSLDEELSLGLDALLTDGSLEKFFSEIDVDHKVVLGAGFRDAVEKILRGEFASAVDIFNLIIKAMLGAIPKHLGNIVVIVSLAILYGISKNLNSGFAKEGVNKAVYYAIYACIIAIVAVIVSDIFVSLKTTVEISVSVIEIIFPVLLGLVSVIGGVTTVASFSAITLTFAGIVLKVTHYIVLPAFLAGTVFSLIGGLSKNTRFDKLASSVRTVAKWTMSITFGVLGTLSIAQGIVGGSIDGVTIRSMKFATQSYLPIVGGYISDGFDIVAASAVLLKNAVGLCIVVVLLLLVIRHIATIAMTSLLLKIAAGIIQPIADDGISDMLYGVSKNVSIAIGLSVGVVFLPMVMIMSIVCAFNGGI